MIMFLKKLFHRHRWEFSGYVPEYDPVHHIRYSRRRYVCSVCGKVMWVDGRFDRRYFR